MTILGKSSKALACVALGLGGAGTALADTGNNPPEQVYAGPVLGYDNVVLSDVGYSINRGGLTYGGLAGIDSPVGEHGRVGLEAQVTGSTTALTVTSGNTLFKFSTGIDLYAGAKFGWMVTPRTQIFGTAGYAMTRLTESATVDGVKQFQAGTNKSGFRVGAGAEYALSRQIRARLEYHYTHYGELKVDGEDTGIKMERHQVMAGLLYGF